MRRWLINILLPDGGFIIVNIAEQDIKFGIFVKETLEEFHRQNKNSRLKWCIEHDKLCDDCKIECEARDGTN